jgi:hypothetical protein
MAFPGWVLCMYGNYYEEGPHNTILNYSTFGTVSKSVISLGENQIKRRQDEGRESNKCT